MTDTLPPRLPDDSEGSTAKLVDPDAASQVLRQFRIVFNAIKTHFQRVERRVGLGGAQVWALSVIRDRPGLGVKGLASAMDVRQPTASNLVRSLARSGLVEVRRDGSDRRAVQLHLLPQGFDVLRRVPGPHRGVLPDALKALPPETLMRLHTDLAALIGHLDPDPRAAQVPLADL
jgi:DNA-binding MarR family transcriptional regulator